MAKKSKGVDADGQELIEGTTDQVKIDAIHRAAQSRNRIREDMGSLRDKFNSCNGKLEELMHANADKLIRAKKDGRELLIYKYGGVVVECEANSTIRVKVGEKQAATEPEGEREDAPGAGKEFKDEN